MVKDIQDKEIKAGSLVCAGVNAGMYPGIVVEVTAPLSVRGGPPQGIQMVRMLFSVEFPIPTHGVCPIAVTDGPEAPLAKAKFEDLRKHVEGMKPGSTGGSLITA